MNPIHNVERRRERARALDKRFERSEDVVYVDAAEYRARDAMTVAIVDYQGQLLTAASLATVRPTEGEEVAIAMAISNTSAKIIVSDSKSAVRNFAKGRVSPRTTSILAKAKNVRKIQITWTPAHSGLTGNERAHDAARGLISQADVDPTSPQLVRSERDRMVSYREIIDHYRLARRKYPAAHRSLTKRDSVWWRQLQTNTFRNPVALSRCYPEIYSGDCKICAGRADLYHMLWSCPVRQNQNAAAKARSDSLTVTNMEQWETALLSPDPEVQLRVVRMAEAAARVQGLLADD